MIILLSFIINTYYKKSKKKINFISNKNQIKKQEILPVYKDAVLSLPMSQTGDPFIYVFLSKDNYKSIVDYYKMELGDSYVLKKIVYSKMMTIYQFRPVTDKKKLEIEEKIKREKLSGAKKIKLLEDYISMGVEIIPLNHLWEKVLEAKTKIKIIIPRKILFKEEKKKNDKPE
jgi:hypothetical protein